MISKLFKLFPLPENNGDKHNTSYNYESDSARNITKATLTHKTVKGIFWMFASFSGSKVLSFISTIVLARILVPSEFGQFGFALLVISYLQIVGDIGTGSALIYQQRHNGSAANISFIINIIAGLLWFTLTQATAPLLATFFKGQDIVPILRVLSFIFIINAFGNTNDVLLRKELAFKRRLVPELVLGFIKASLAVTLAILGYGVWSLVWGHLIGTLAGTIALWLVFPWKPRIEFPWKLAKKMLNYGWKIATVNVLAAVVHHLDYLIVGGMLGSAAFGYYSLAYKIPELTIIVVLWGVGKVMFPAYSKMQNDILSLKRAYLGTLRYVSLVTIPAGCGIALLSSIIIYTLYGDRWGPSIPVLQVLAITGVFRSLSSTNGDIYKATGRPDILVKLSLLRSALLIPALIYGTRFGIVGVAVAQTLITFLGTLLSFYIISIVLSISIKSIISEFKTSIIASMIMVVGLYFLNPIISDLPNVLNLLLGIFCGFVFYLISTYLISPDTLVNARIIIVSSLKKVA